MRIEFSVVMQNSMTEQDMKLGMENYPFGTSLVGVIKGQLQNALTHVIAGEDINGNKIDCYLTKVDIYVDQTDDGKDVWFDSWCLKEDIVAEVKENESDC